MQQLSGGCGIPAVGATIGVNAVNADRAGNFYICDEFQNIVYKVDSQGNITVLAGNGIKTFSGDGGPTFVAPVSRHPSPRTRYSDSSGKGRSG